MTLAEIDAKLARIDQEPQATPFERERVRLARKMWKKLRDAEALKNEVSGRGD